MKIVMLADQKRLHLQHGPIDLVIEAFGSQVEIAKAYYRASQRFATILEELAGELPLLRSPVKADTALPVGAIARAMRVAVDPHMAEFITPMAAVAGAVADEILQVLCRGGKLDKAYVNNGGDIALYVNPQSDASLRTGIVANPLTGELVTTATIRPDTAVKGIATSGRHGRSHSFGIADAVTVFAANAGVADAAATIIANKVDLPCCQQIERQPADQLSPDSDLGARPVTIRVGQLTRHETITALTAGQKKAESLCRAGVIKAAFLCLGGMSRIVDWSIDPSSAFAPHLLSQPITQDRIAHA